MGGKSWTAQLKGQGCAGCRLNHAAPLTAADGRDTLKGERRGSARGGQGTEAGSVRTICCPDVICLAGCRPKGGWEAEEAPIKAHKEGLIPPAPPAPFPPNCPLQPPTPPLPPLPRPFHDPMLRYPPPPPPPSPDCAPQFPGLLPSLDKSPACVAFPLTTAPGLSLSPVSPLRTQISVIGSSSAVQERRLGL